MQHPFKTLTLIALGKATALQEPISPGLWHHIYSMGVKQAMVGVLWQGVKRLPKEQLPPQDLYEEWRSKAEKIEAFHDLHLAHTDSLRGLFAALGLRACLLKGTSLAALYPEPACRQSGDIDVWVAGSHKDTISALKDSWKISEVLWQECKVAFFDDTIVEVHFHPTKMYNPFLNARLQRTLERLAPKGFLPCSEGSGSACGGLSIPDQRFNAVFCMAHMLRHYLEGGIGFRQMLDYYFVVRLLSSEDKCSAFSDLKKLGMSRFAGAVMFVLKKAFALEEEFFLCEPDEKYGSKLMDEILAYGNFGAHDSRNKAREGETRLQRFIRKNARVFSNFRGYSREVFWAPYARIKQFLWQRTHRYI